MRSTVSLLTFLAIAGAVGAQELHPRIKVVADLGAAYVDRVFDSPNGKYLVIDGGTDIRIQRRDGSLAATIPGVLRTAWWSVPSVTRSRNRVAFLRHDDQTKNNYVWTAAIDTASGALIGEPRRISIHSGNYPSFSPDGRSIRYVRSASGKSTIVAIPASGGEEREIVTVDGNIGRQETTPDGKWIYFEHKSPGFGMVERVPSTGGTPQRLVRTTWFCGISRDGKFFAAYAADSRPYGSAHPQIVIYNMAGAETARAELPLGLEVPSWSSASPDRMVGIVYGNPRVLRSVTLADGSARDLPTRTESDANPLLTPNGRKLVSLGVVRGRQQFMIADIDGSNRHAIPTREEPDDKWTTGREMIAPDGGHIAYRSHDNERLNVLDLSSGVERSLVVDTAKITRFAWRSDGQALLYQNRANTLGAIDIRAVSLDGKSSLIRRFSQFAAGDPENTKTYFINDTLLVAMTGTMVATVSLRSGSIDTVFRAARVNAATTSSDPDVSPDGKWFAFNAADKSDTIQAHIISLDGRQRRDVPAVGCINRIKGFHPNARDVIVLVRIHCKTPQSADVLYIVPLNGDQPRAITGATDSILSGVALNPDGSRVIIDSGRAAKNTIVQIDFPGLAHK